MAIGEFETILRRRVDELERIILDLEYLGTDNRRWCKEHLSFLKTVPGMLERLPRDLLSDQEKIDLGWVKQDGYWERVK